MTYGFKTSRKQFCNRFDNKTSYEKLGLAMKHCQRNDECAGIYDDDCDAFGDLKLCSAVGKISDGVMLDSCIYVKGPGKSRRAILSFQHQKIIVLSVTLLLYYFFCFQAKERSLVKHVSIAKVDSNEFDVFKLKKDIAEILKKDDNKIAIAKDKKHCQTLDCRCIVGPADFNYRTHPSTIYLENDVSNICLKILDFLILDGESNINSHIDILFEQSMIFLDKQRGPDKIMVEVFYPIYLTSFQPTYRKLSNRLNHSDPFTYDQRITAGGRYFYDGNYDICENTYPCKDSINKMVSTWQKVVNIFSFDWKMEIGSMVANFNYVLMMCCEFDYLQKEYVCSDSLQIAEERWAPNAKLFNPSCKLKPNGKGLNELIQTVTEEIFNVPFNGVYLNDLIGYLGYSSTFDLLALQKHRYMYTARELHPIVGIDSWILEKEEGWNQTNYLATYQNWVTHKSILDKNRTIGERKI